MSVIVKGKGSRSESACCEKGAPKRKPTEGRTGTEMAEIEPRKGKGGRGSRKKSLVAGGGSFRSRRGVHSRSIRRERGFRLR